MSELTAERATRLWTDTGFVADEWVHVENADALAGNRRVILPLAAYLELDEAKRVAAADRLGVLVAPAEPIEALAPHLDHLALVALAFPAFSDGRSYSKAELLRRRHGFTGKVRATGDVLIDQVSHMLRTGFDELEVTNETALKRLEDGRPGGIGHHYQPTARPAAQGQAYSWRRLSPG